VPSKQGTKICHLVTVLSERRKKKRGRFDSYRQAQEGENKRGKKTRGGYSISNPPHLKRTECSITPASIGKRRKGRLKIPTLRREGKRKEGEKKKCESAVIATVWRRKGEAQINHLYESKKGPAESPIAGKRRGKKVRRNYWRRHRAGRARVSR